MKLSGHRWKRESCGVPREPMYSLLDFAGVKHLSYRSLVAVMNRSADRPAPAATIDKVCRSPSGGDPYRQRRNLYKLGDLEAWFDRHREQIRVDELAGADS